jgi:hypothetical protein
MSLLLTGPSYLFSFVIRESFLLTKALLIFSFFSNLLTFITSTMALSLLVLFLFSRSLAHFTFYSFVFHYNFCPSSSLVENRSFGVTGSFLLLACYYRFSFSMVLPLTAPSLLLVYQYKIALTLLVSYFISVFFFAQLHTISIFFCSIAPPFPFKSHIILNSVRTDNNPAVILFKIN